MLSLRKISRVFCSRELFEAGKPGLANRFAVLGFSTAG
jgi:hypothetical protein